MKHYYLYVFILTISSVCQAQINSRSTVHTPRGYVEPFDLNVYKEVSSQREKVFQRNSQSIADQIQAISNRIEDLSALDDNASERIKGSLSDYVEKLNQRIDWSQDDNYKAAVNGLGQINKMVSQAYESVRLSQTNRQPEPAKSIPSGNENINRTAETFLYASIFQKPDESSKLVHSVDKNETVTVLGINGGYYYVRCGRYEGYLNKGMVKQFIR